MLVRVYSQPLEVQETILDFLRSGQSNTYEVVDEPLSPLLASEAALRSTLLGPPSPPSAPRVIPLAPESQISQEAQSTEDSRLFKFPKDWIIFPLFNRGKASKKTVRLHVAEDNTLNPNAASPLSGTIDVDWCNPTEPVKFTAVQHQQPFEGDDHGHDQDVEDFKTTAESICFSVVHDVKEDEASAVQLSPHGRGSSDSGSDDTEPLTEEKIRQLHQDSRHLVRVITRNSLGLAASTALAGVAPQLLIAAAINAFFLTRGAKKLHAHRIEMKGYGLRIRKRDIAVAVAEGLTVKLAVMIITINHADFLVFTNSVFAHGAETIVAEHEAVVQALPGADAMSNALANPIERAMEACDIPEMGGGWSLATKQLLESIFLVGAVQAGVESLVELVQSHVGKASTKAKKRTRDRIHRHRRVKGRSDSGDGRGVGHAGMEEKRRTGLTRSATA